LNKKIIIKLIRPITNIQRKDYSGTSFNQQKHRTNANNRRGTYNNNNRENHCYHPPSHIPTKPSKLTILF